MDVSVNYILSQAYDLIEVNRIDEARELLEPLLISHADDVDVWWLYAHSVNDPQKACQALEQVNMLDPRRYPRAESLLEDLDNTTSMIPMSLESLPKRVPSSPETFDMDDSVEEDDDLDDEDETKPSTVVMYGLPLAVALIATIVIVFSLLSRPIADNRTPPPQPLSTSVEQVLSVPTIGIIPTELMEAQSIEADLKFTTLPTIQKTTELGETTLFQLCIDEYDLSPSQLVNEVMQEVAQQLPSMSIQSQAVGVELSYCQQNTLYRSVAVPLESAEQYGQGVLSESDYRRSVKAVE